MHIPARSRTFAVALFVGGLSTQAHAALLCADSAASLQSALSTAQSNGEDDEIDLVAGTYTLSAGLSYVANEAHSLTIFGGYTANCAALAGSATLLSGNSMVQILYINQGSSSSFASVHVERVTFAFGNAASSNGGALGISTQGGDVRLELNRFLFNQSAQNAGALVVASSGLITLRNNLFVGNSAPNRGAARLVTGNSVAYVIGNTIVGNTATAMAPNNPSGSPPIGGLEVINTGGGHFWLVNNILWNNSGGFDLSGGDLVRFNNDIGTAITGPPNPIDSGNLSVDPDFAPCSGFLCLGFELKRASPLVDAGNNAAPTGIGSVDLAGKPRRIGPDVDIGAFEQDVLFTDGFD